MIQDLCGQTRPNFLTPEDWLEDYLACLDAGRRPWHPVTRDELLLAEDEGLLCVHQEWRPCAEGLRLLGLPEWFGRSPDRLSDWWQERLLMTLVTDLEFRSALRTLMMGGAES